MNHQGGGQYQGRERQYQVQQLHYNYPYPPENYQNLQQHQQQSPHYYPRRRRPQQNPAVLTAMDRIRTGWSDSFCLDLVSLDATNVHHMAYFLYRHQGMVRQLRLYACSLPQQQQQQGQGGQEQDNNSTDPAVARDNDASLQQLRTFVQESDFLRKVTFSYCELGNDMLAKLLLRQGFNVDDELAVTTTTGTTATTNTTAAAPGHSMVQELDLSRNQLQGTIGGEILGQLLVHEMPRLKRLDLQINPLGPGGALGLQSTLDRFSISQQTPSPALILQDLNLRCCGLGNQGLNILVDILTKSHGQEYFFPDLTHLNLAYNHIQGTAGGTALAQLLQGHAGLQKLRLSGNALGVAGARALAPGLATNKTLETLRLDYCHVGNDGLQAIVDSLVVVNHPKKGRGGNNNKSRTSQGNSGLKVLTLHSNGFTSGALPSLTRLLNHKESCLEHLNLSTNRHLLADNETPTGASTASTSRRRPEPESSLSLSSSSSVASLTQDFALAVAHNTILRTLSVYDCGMEDHARAMVFLSALKRANTTLESLRLAGASSRHNNSDNNKNKVLGAAEIEAICQSLGRRNQLLSHAATLKGSTATSATIVFGLSRLANEKDGSSAAFQIVRDKLFYPL